MTVEPGFGGQKFMADQLGKVAAFKREIRRRGLAVRLEVDGGIDGRSAALVAANGADLLVAGTAVFRHPEGMEAGVRAIHAVQDQLDTAL